MFQDELISQYVKGIPVVGGYSQSSGSSILLRIVVWTVMWHTQRGMHNHEGVA